MKRAIAIFCAALLVIISFLTGAAAEKNLLPNGGFESIASSGMPEDWYATAYRSQAGYSRMTVTDEAFHSGSFSALVENASANDARFTCTVKVKPESLYRLSGYVRVESMQDTGNGANFGIEGIYSFSDGLFDTNGEWQYLEWYGETGEKQTEVTIGVRVGGYSAESVGKAYFDDIVLEEVDELPQGVIASLWYSASAGRLSSSDPEENTSEKSTVLFVLLGVAFLLLTALLIPVMEKQGLQHSAMAVLGLLLLSALLLRIFLGMRVEGYEVDINCFKAWSMRMAHLGPVGFYAPDYFCDYPPGAMLLLWPVGMLLNSVGLGNKGVGLLIVKLLPILCDLAGAVCLYWYAFKKRDSVTAAVLAALYLFNPAALVNGAAWGQMDSVLALLMLFTTFAAIQRKWKLAIPLFVISALVKPQALLLAPVGGMALVFHVFEHRGKERKAILLQAFWGAVLAVCAGLVIVVPFAIGQENPFSWLFELYGGTLGSYAYATLNTANLYYLADANWMPLSQQVPAMLCIVPAILFACASVALLCRKTAERICSAPVKARLLSVLLGLMAVVLIVMLALKASYHWYGYLMMAFAYAFAIICLAFERRMEGALPYYMALALIGVYVLGIKVHERYLFPALLLLPVAFIGTRDRRVLGVFAGFSITTFINTAIVLDNSILFGSAQGHLNADTLVLNNALSIINLLLCAYAGWIGLNGLRESKPFTHFQKKQPDEKSGYHRMLFAPQDHRLHLSVRDYLIMGITTILYAVLAFSNLGSMVAPQTAWVSTSEDEYVVLELDESSKFSVMYYAGVSYNDFSIAVSKDGVNWSEDYPCEMREGLCYRWNYALKTSSSNGEVSYPSSNPSNVLWLEGKYLRVNARSAGLNLWEIVARGENGENLSMRLIAHANAQPQLLDGEKPAANLIDEQHTCTGEPGWFTGTYFDEIYHARTAYEHLHGQAPYETTHPPLGKLLMSVGIAIFGMTPFGWRFAGALIGVLMLPAIYLLAMQLTHKRTVAGVSMLAFALDLMHFTQTRIATIDSFPVFFILLTYLFMIRFMQMDAFAVSDPENPKLLDKAYLRTLVPLFFCGICMGLSIASKWIGIYSAAGLAVLFFLTMYRHARVCDAAWETAEEEANERVLAARQLTIHRIAVTCGFCIIFFVLIPCAIYCLSYIPYLSPTGPVTLKRIIRAQEGMLSYHSTPGLGMDHPFQSPWWQWPFILKPMWFAQDSFEPAGYASTILCFGNPWVFYFGAFAMAIVLLLWLGGWFRYADGQITIRHGSGDLTLAILSVAFLAQYLPWVLVPRSMYMYHYFASVPFIIMATAVLIEWLTRSKPALRKAVIAIYLLGTLAFFVMFFPYASGYLTRTEWLDAMKWFSKLYY